MSARRCPNWFILGAPKCGTTTLAGWLSDHPHVFMSTPKEPHFFNTDMSNRNVRRREDYCALFQGAEERHVVVGEASTWYLFSKDAVGNIERSLPGSRYVVMGRDPVEMAHSLYLHNLRFLQDDAPSFQDAWQLQETRAAGAGVPRTCVDAAFLQYRAACSLGAQLERLLRTVPVERVCHVRLEEMAADPAVEYRRVLDFLEVADDGRARFEPRNEARVPRSPLLHRLLLGAGRARRALGFRKGVGLLRLNEKAQKKPQLSESMRASLRAEFEADSRLLNDLVDHLS